MIGIPFIIISVIVTIVLFLLSKIGLPEEIRIWTLLSQISGLLGSVLISWNFLLSIRTLFIEKGFGGLDKVYKTHNILGQLAFILIINHPLFLIINSLPFNSTKLYLVPSLTNLPYLFGILSFYTLLILLVLTIFLDMPYKYWKRTHEYMGLVIIFASIHSLLIISDVSRFMPLRYWILAWDGVALLAFIYKRYLYYIFRKKNNYKVVDILHEQNYLMITLVPIDPNNFLVFKPGQFAFFSIDAKSREEHPFSILEQDGEKIKIGTKIIGNFTLRLSNLKTGDTVSVNGPHGVFGESLEKGREMVWISGGIGITPFLSMIKASSGRDITMIHTGHSSDSNLFVNIFKNYSYYFPNFKFIHHASDLLGRLNQNVIKNYVNLSPSTFVYLCGPNNMMEYLTQELPKTGVKRKHIIFEDFKMK